MAMRAMPGWARWLPVLSSVALITTSCASGHPALSKAAAASSCTDPQRNPTVYNTPQVPAFPVEHSVSLIPHSGGLEVTVRFRRPLVKAPEGVLIAWQIFIFHTRAHAANSAADLTLTFEDRGQGWEPTGWTVHISASDGSSNNVGGEVHLSHSGKILSVFYPAGFGNLRPPFYWYANQYGDRAYMPTDRHSQPRNWNINGTLSSDCPAGIRSGPDSTPSSTRLLLAAS